MINNITEKDFLESATWIKVPALLIDLSLNAMGHRLHVDQLSAVLKSLNCLLPFNTVLVGSYMYLFSFPFAVKRKRCILASERSSAEIFRSNLFENRVKCLLKGSKEFAYKTVHCVLVWSQWVVVRKHIFDMVTVFMQCF